MLTTNLALDDASGDEIAFNLQAYLPDGSRRIDTASTPTEPRLLEIKHSTSGKDATAVDRHLISASVSKFDGAGQLKKGIVNVTFTQPRSTAISNTDLLDLFSSIVDLLCDGGFGSSGMTGTTNASAILRGES
uniref:Uncharacterized protein n=1 Tax=Leviviridae sp. TaxID=2027243 RepID=A0A514DBQ1_9VIRU|nr:MAG: hypothetical protein H2Rhizo33936_000002 [Leviviridae sp.]